MRLLHTDSLKLHEFHGDQIPKYAILSHTWGESEVSFENLQSRNKLPHKTMIFHGEIWEEVWLQDSPNQSNEDSAGWHKIKGCCSVANQNGYEYVWIDTCCINKESSAELTEAINSMFQWYKKAEICYVYLQGFQGNSLATLNKHRWFDRGWTLQELIAPTRVIFFNDAWKTIGDKTTFSQMISNITKIDVSLLTCDKRLEDFSIAERMSWASSRTTTRLEDRAYSLLGLFQVSIPLLYGEGEVQAFRRLQEEIIKNSDDHSIFAWPLSAEVGNHGLLAWTPTAFEYADGIKSVRFRKDRDAYSITNKGVSITFNLIPWSTDTYLAPLNCAYGLMLGEKGAGSARMGIFLRRLYEDGRDAQGTDHFVIQRRTKDSIWNAPERIFALPNGSENYGDFLTLDISMQHKKIKLIRFGFNHEFDPFCFLAESTAIDEKVHLMNKSGSFNIGEASERQWTDKEREEFKSFASRSVSDQWGWNRIERARGVVLARANDYYGSGFRSRLWMLRGDRVDGLNVCLEGLASDRDSPGAQFKIERVQTYEGWVWDISLDGLASSGLGRAKNLFKKGET